MWMDPLLDFTRTVLPAENVPETSCIHSLPCARYNRGLGLCAAAAETKPAARITVASCMFLFIVASFFSFDQLIRKGCKPFPFRFQAASSSKQS
jgi:hypothetical protein